MPERRNDPPQIAVINAALGVAGVVARDGVLERLLAGAVGLHFKLIGTVKNLPTGTQICAWVQERLGTQPTALGFRGADLHQSQVNRDAVALGSRGNGRLALDLLPAVLNLAFCTVFARSLGPEAMPLLARIIEAIEGRGRLALPRVADYARALTWAWTLLLGMQAALRAWLALRDFGAVAFPALSGSQWRWYLHFGSYALVPAFLVLEYAFRRWWLRHIPHASLAHFLVQLTRNWPALIRSVALDASRTGR